MKQAIRSREPVPLPLKPKKMLARSNSIAAATTKRLSLAADCVEVENKSATTILGEKNPLKYGSISNTIKGPFDWRLADICLNAALQGNLRL